jgi:hypothetical protein
MSTIFTDIFLFSLHEKTIFHFLKAETSFFGEYMQQKAQCGLVQTLSIKIIDHFYIMVHIPAIDVSLLVFHTFLADLARS